MKTIDPACGSGIFLRTLLEFQCAPPFDGLSTSEIKTIFSQSYGIDIDENAVQATTLSLSLLHMVLMGGKLPERLNIETKDILDVYFDTFPNRNSFDVVISNPPFVSFDSQTDIMRQKIKAVLDNLAEKRPDSYLAFIKIALDLLKPGGYGLFVLPHSFLRNVSAKNIRRLLADNASIKSLIDLSSIQVFENQNIYVILLIFQKRNYHDIQNSIEENKVKILVCQEFAGNALQDYLAGRNVENAYYNIFDVDQNIFKNDDWSVALEPPSTQSILKKLERFQSLNTYLEIKQGIVTGGDKVFIIHKSKLPHKEKNIWKPLLRDRDMMQYSVPNVTDYYIFYPKLNGYVLNESQLKENYPLTWEYLSEHKDMLPSKKAKDINWWRPLRLRNEDKLFISKIVTPHLVLVPKFSLDEDGKYAISRTPFLISKIQPSDSNVLKYFLGILNSSIGAWLISRHTDKYSRGYARLEVNTLSSIPVPDPTKIDFITLKKMINIVDKKINGDNESSIDFHLDQLVVEAYGLTREETKSLGILDDA